ncbi:hypothetical protein [Pelagibius sp. Alg239-R121]|uniref:hypothetical protein n=1 Tax=Pelagibius sp. Alg239-R121 TaxID=2993448 RepID=UPI0024A64492|nr:hypothetical protein [Pelagibius sp. Alg239-R121]
MTIGSLLSMQPTWLLEDHWSIGDSGKFRPKLTGAGLPNTEVITWANAQCKVDRGGGMVKVAPDSNKSYGFLPWQPSGVTYMEIDPNAQLVLTGPLSACTVWAFESGGTTVLVHANANTGTDWTAMSPLQKDNNMLTKLGYVNAIKGLYAAPTDVARLVYAATPGVAGAQTYEGYMGFVLGTKARLGFTMNKVKWAASTKADDWSFYFYGYNGTAATDRVLWPL